MDLGTIIGLAVALCAIFGAAVVESGDPSVLSAFVSIPSFLIVFGGTLGVTVVAFPGDRIRSLPKVIQLAFRKPKTDDAQLVETFAKFADQARREGLLTLESDVAALEDPFIRKGLLLVVDGTDPSRVREILEADLSAMAARHKSRYAMLEAMGGFAPTLGIIGTVMGLVNVLSHLDQPDQLGKSISTAFIATFYGVLSANALWLPLGQRLKQRHQTELASCEMMVEGILSVQSGDNPRVVREKLECYLAPSLRNKERAEDAAIPEMAA